MEAFENVLEMIFVCCSRSISPVILEEYFEPCPEGAYSNVGLNIVPPLMQGRELAPTVRGEYTKLLERSDDPEISERPKVRALQEMQPRTSKGHMTTLLRFTPGQYIQFLHESFETDSKLAGNISWQNKDKVPWITRGEQNSVDVKEWIKGVSDWLLDQRVCDADGLACPVGNTTASIGIVLDAIPSHSYDDNVEVSWGLRESGFTKTNSLIWYASFQKHKLIPRTLRVSRHTHRI